MRLGTVCYEGRQRVVADLGNGRMLDLHLAAENALENEGFVRGTLLEAGQGAD